MKANSWLYHYYMVQSRLQYSLAYGGQSPTALAAAFYPQMSYPAGAAGYQVPENAFHPSSAFLPSPYSASTAYSGYTPPPGAYQLQGDSSATANGDQGGSRGGGSSSGGGKDRSESPLDFSSAANSNSFTEWQQDGSNDDLMTSGSGFGNFHNNNHIIKGKANFALNRNGQGGVQVLERSPDYDIDESSSSPLQMTSLDSGNIISNGTGDSLTTVTTIRTGNFFNSSDSVKQAMTDLNQNETDNFATTGSDQTLGLQDIKPSLAELTTANGLSSDQKKWVTSPSTSESSTLSPKPDTASK